MCKVAIAHRKPKNAPHAHTLQVSKKWVRTCTWQLATAHRNLQLAIAHRKSCFDWYHNNPLKADSAAGRKFLSLPLLNYGFFSEIAQGEVCLRNYHIQSWKHGRKSKTISNDICKWKKNRYYVRHMFSRIPNLRIHEFFSRNFLSKQGRIFVLRSKVLLKLFLFTKKTLCSSFKRKQDIFRENVLWIRGLGIRENMSRAS